MDKSMVVIGVLGLLTVGVLGYIALRPSGNGNSITQAPNPTIVNNNQLSDSTGDTLTGIGRLVNSVAGAAGGIVSTVRTADRQDAAQALDAEERRSALADAAAARANGQRGQTTRGT